MRRILPLAADAKACADRINYDAERSAIADDIHEAMTEGKYAVSFLGNSEYGNDDVVSELRRKGYTVFMDQAEEQIRTISWGSAQ